MIKAQWYCLCT